jgi:hypothetical protein
LKALALEMGSDKILNWLVGFTDGEGTFFFNKIEASGKAGKNRLRILNRCTHRRHRYIKTNTNFNLAD